MGPSGGRPVGWLARRPDAREPRQVLPIKLARSWKNKLYNWARLCFLAGEPPTAHKSNNGPTNGSGHNIDHADCGQHRIAGDERRASVASWRRPTCAQEELAAGADGMGKSASEGEFAPALHSAPSKPRPI